MTSPVRLQLSRRKGFSLQEHSRSINGLPAVNVARPTKWGNPVTKDDFLVLNDILSKIGREPIEGTWQDHAIKCFDAWIGGEIPEMGAPPTVDEIISNLRGKNLACWCNPGDPCHVDILLEIANRPICEEVKP